MLDTMLSYIAPHYCYGCGKIGHLLCDNCKYNIILEPFSRCIICESPTALDALCQTCKPPYQRAWCVGERANELQQLIDAFKFQNAKAAYKPLAELIDQTLPILPASTTIIPIPTVAAHIRQRGYDHTLLIARHLARLRRLEASTVLQRVGTTKQRDATREQRIHQAKTAFACNASLDPTIPYLLVDDVVTTGATLKYAAKTLRSGGAKIIWVVSVSHQSGSVRRAL